MVYLNTILQLLMALLLLAQLLVMATAWFTNAVTIWQRLSMTFTALVLAGGHLVIMYGFGYLADAHVPIAGWTWFALVAAVLLLLATIAGASRHERRSSHR